MPARTLLMAQPAAAGGSLTGAYQDVAADDSNTSTYSFTGVGIGAASSDRTVVAVIGMRGTGGLSSATVTIGGVSASVDVVRGFTGTGNAIVIASAEVPTGTTATIAFSPDAAGIRAGVTTYSITGASVAVSDTFDVLGTAPDPIDCTLNPTAADGFAIAGLCKLDFETTWTTLTEDYDGQPGPELLRLSSASGATSAGSLDFTVNNTIDSTTAIAAVAYEAA